MKLLVYKPFAEEPSLILRLVLTAFGDEMRPEVHYEFSGNAECESCRKDFVQDLSGPCVSEPDPLYFRCGRCRRLQLFVLLHKKLGRDLAKMVAVEVKKQEALDEEEIDGECKTDKE